MKHFRNLGILAIAVFSFFYTEKIAEYTLKNNELYKTIENEKSKYNIKSISAEVNGEYIVPGLNGITVNVKDSYYNMKDIDTFNEYYLKYDIDYPKESIENNLDKIINKGNKEKNSISFILEYDESIIQYFINNGYEASVLIQKENFNKDLKLEQINFDYTNYNDLETLLNRHTNNTDICYINDNNIELCKKNNKYLVQTDKIINDSTIIKIKQNINSGDIYLVKKNTAPKNIQIIINSILYRDLDIVSLSKLISEERPWLIIGFLV